MRMALLVALSFLNISVHASSFSTRMSLAVGVKDHGEFRTTQAERETTIGFTCRRTTLNFDDIKSRLGFSPTGDSQFHFATSGFRDWFAEDASARILDEDMKDGQACMARLEFLERRANSVSLREVLDGGGNFLELQYCNKANHGCSTDPLKINLP